MANIQERRDKSGKLISYSIRVYRGLGADGKQLKPWTTTFDVSPTWTEKSARKRAEAFASVFEAECKSGVIGNSRKRFDEYAEYCIGLKEEMGLKHSTVTRYRDLTERIFAEIGHIKLSDLRADHLNSFYSKLAKNGAKKAPTKATAKIDLVEALKAKKLTRAGIAKAQGLPVSTVESAVKGEAVQLRIAEGISRSLGVKVGSAFEVEKPAPEPLSPATIRKYHNFISTVLDHAVKEGLIPYNAADRATKPKVKQREAEYFQPEQIAAIRDALELEPIKWKTFTHLLLITGARRGEVLGLSWENVDFQNNRIRLCMEVMYRADVGVYMETPKTEKSKRFVVLPAETMQLLKQYKAWQASEKLRLGTYYEDRGLVFARDNGLPLHPDSVNGWLNKFSKRHGLPHIHPHAFRHTMASMLYFNGMDSVSISKRLGHAQTSTTANIYAHVIEAADQRNADILADIFLKKA